MFSPFSSAWPTCRFSFQSVSFPLHRSNFLFQKISTICSSFLLICVQNLIWKEQTLDYLSRSQVMLILSELLYTRLVPPAPTNRPASSRIVIMETVSTDILSSCHRDQWRARRPTADREPNLSAASAAASWGYEIGGEKIMAPRKHSFAPLVHYYCHIPSSTTRWHRTEE